MKKKVMAVAAAIILSLAVIGCSKINQADKEKGDTEPYIQTSLDSTENGDAETEGSAEPEDGTNKNDKVENSNMGSTGNTGTENSTDKVSKTGTEDSENPKNSENQKNSVNQDSSGGQKSSQETHTAGGTTERLPDSSQSLDEQASEGQTSENQAAGNLPTGNQAENGYMVAIDAGHQAKGNKEKEPLGPGSDEQKAKVSSGTRGVSTGIYEYELTLTISQALKTELESRGYGTVMIRDTAEVDISNKERAETANESGADIFLRIHANGSQDSKVQGTLTICNTSKSPFNPEIYEQSKSLSQLVVDHMTSIMESKNRGVWETDTMSGINWCKIPVSIIEMGYMSNGKEDELMQDETYQNKIVRGIADGVDAYFAANP